MMYKTKWNNIWESFEPCDGKARIPQEIIDYDETFLTNCILSRTEANLLKQMCIFEQKKEEYTHSDLLLRYLFDVLNSCDLLRKSLSPFELEKCLKNLKKKGYINEE